MKMKNMKQAIAFYILALSSGTALATDSTGNWNVSGMNGIIVATGNLVSSPCFIAPESNEQHITLGDTSTRFLNNQGTVTPPVSITLVLDGCPDGPSFTRSPEQMRGSLLLSSQPAVRIQLSGAAENTDKRLFRVHGNASGIAVGMEDSYGEQLSPGMSSRPLPLLPGRNEIALKAQLWKTSEQLIPGDWRAVVNVGLEYE